MKFLPLLGLMLSASLLLAGLTQAEEKKQPKAEDAEVVAVQKEFPEAAKRERFLWDTFETTEPVQRFNNFSIEDWQQGYTDFTDCLVKRAKDQKLDADGLKALLEKIRNHAGENKLAYVPVAAFDVTSGGKKIWVIAVVWETPTFLAQLKRLSHVRLFAFDAESKEQVGFVTCR